MTTTRLFRNGHSQAVRIPAELAYERNDLELGALRALVRISPDFMATGRGDQDQSEREAL